MKVAIFSSDIDETNGYGNITNGLCGEFVKAGLDFELFVPQTVKARCVGKNFKINPILPGVSKKNFFGFFKKITLKNFNLAHSLFDFPHCFMAARSAKSNHLPFIMGSQGTYGVLPLTEWPEKYFLKWAYRRAREIIVPSEFTKEKIIECAGESRPYNISVIHNGVNFERFNAAKDISNLRAKYQDNKILLTVGGLKPRKGQDLVIRALPEVLKKHPEVKYLVIGDGPWKKHLIDLATSLNVKNYVEFAGVLKDDELVKYFQLCDIYAHTPRVVNLNFEGFGIVYLEASASGKPIVASDAGGIRDAVIHGKTGLIAPDGDVAKIAEYINNLLDNPDYARELGRNGTEYARSNDWSVIAGQFIEKYKKYAIL